MNCFIPRFAVPVGIVLLLLAGNGWAQTGQNFGEIVGKVVDEQGGVLPGVLVTLSGASVMGAATATTSEHGIYRFPAVPPGTCKLTFELAGFSSFVHDGIIIAVRNTVTIDATMKLASLSESVIVSGQSPVVDVENAKVGQRLDGALLAAVPTQRTIFGTATVLPGVVMGTQDVGGLKGGTSSSMVAHGASKYNFNYFGVSADAAQDYGPMYYVDYGSFQEISVDTAAMGAEIGGGGGANINLIPKSGSNTFAGSVFFTGTGKGLAGSNVNDALRAQGITQGTALLKLYDGNVDVGGPVKKDKLWFYVSYRQFKTLESVIGFPRDFKTTLQNNTVRVNYKLTQNNNLSLFWTRFAKMQPNRSAAFNRPPENTVSQPGENNLENVNFTSVMAQNTFLELSSSMFRLYFPTGYSDDWYTSAKLPASYDIVRNTYWGAYDGGERFRNGLRWQMNGAVTHYKDSWLGGNHQLKAGYEWWYGWGTDRFQVYQDTVYRYRSGVPAEIYVFNTPLIARTHQRSVAAFAQDRVTFSRFTVNLGLRYSFFDGFLPEQSGGGGRWYAATTYSKVQSPFSWSTLAPRASLVVKLTSDNKNVIKASYGRYFENLYTWYFSDVINPNVLSTTGLATYAWTGDANSNGVVDAGEYNPNPLRVFVPRNNSVDPNLEDPKTDEIMAEYQRELAPNVGLSVSYFQRWFTDNWADVNVGIPASAYVPRTLVDPGPDNFINTSDDRTITMYDVAPGYVGKDAFKRQTVPGTTRYKSLELSMNRRMTNNWQLQGSYVWSRLDGAYTIGTRQLNDPSNPNQMIDTNHLGRGGSDQPQAFKVLGNYRAPYDINMGINWQMLAGLPRQREFRQALSQGTTTIRADESGTFRRTNLKLLSVRFDKSFRLGGTARVSAFAELHNALNANAGQAYSTLTQAWTSPAQLTAANAGTTGYFGRVTDILPPRVLKFGAKFEF